MEENLDLHFCDLCNTSVPERDLETGAALRVKDKVVGACCNAELRKALPAAGEGRLLPVALVFLVAVAAATVFLDMRMSEELDDARRDVGHVQGAVGHQGDRLLSLEERIDGLARSEQVRSLGAEVEEIGSDERERDELLRQKLQQQQIAIEGLGRRIGELGSSVPDPAPQLEALGKQLTAMMDRLDRIEELAGSRPGPMPPGPSTVESAEPAGPADPGLSPELAHQVSRLDDADPGTRFEAVDELLRSGAPEALEYLIPMARDPDAFVRRLTVEGLAGYRRPEAVDTLIAALMDPEEIVRDTAYQSLRHLTDQKIPYDATASRDDRAKRQERWSRWWADNRDEFE